MTATDLELVDFVSWAHTYAPYQYECENFAPKTSRLRAEAALGRDYLARLKRVTVALSIKYGVAAVEQASTHVTPGYRLSSKTCRRFAKLVPDALDRLRELERRTEDNQ